MGELNVQWCTHKAAKYAVTRWHYSKTMPVPPRVMFGVWEDGEYIGTVIYSRGASSNIGKPYLLRQSECVELTRVALGEHSAEVSKIIKITISMLKKYSPRLRMIVSYADPYHDHNGGIYQAGNWVYTGQTPKATLYVDANGKQWHSRQVSRSGDTVQFGSLRRSTLVKKENCTEIQTPPKYRYLYPLDKAMRKRVNLLSKPYPKKLASVV